MSSIARGVTKVLKRLLTLAFLTTALFTFGLAQAAPVKLTHWQYNERSRTLEFVLNGDNAEPKLSFYLSPSRLVIDLPGVQLGRSSRTNLHDPQVLQVRAGQPDNLTARLVVELAHDPDMTQVNLVKIAATRWRLKLSEPALASQPVSDPTDTTVATGTQASEPVPSLPASSNQGFNLPASGTRLPSVYLNNFAKTAEGFLIRTSGPVEATVRRLDDPPRLVVDVPGAVLPTTLTERALTSDRLGVQKIRIGQFSAVPPIARIVLDIIPDTWDWETAYDPRFKGVRLVPAGRLALNPIPEPKHGTSLLSAALVGDRLVFSADGPLSVQAAWNALSREYQLQFNASNLAPDFHGPKLNVTSPVDRLRLFPSEGQTVTAILKLPQGISVSRVQKQRSNQQFSIRLAKMSLPPPTLGHENNPSTPTPNPVQAGKPLIFVDAGHGGMDPGALGVGGLQEKDINLKLARMLGRKLADSGYRVGYTRQDDRFIPLQGRVDMAQQANADLFISLHSNASDSPWSQGVETYYLRPNSYSLAAMVQRAASRSTGRGDRGVHQARFYVIRYTTMPAILLEAGYVTNPTESRQLTDDSQQQVMADAVAQALDRFIRGKK